MPKIEKQIQSRFFDMVINQDKGFENTKISVYQKLVYLRFEESIKNAFPLFARYCKNEDFNFLIKEFMKESTKAPYIWKVPNYFRKFVKKNKLFEKEKFVYEFLYFDWIEIELLKTQYKEKKLKKFSFKKDFKLSKSTRIKKFKYDIISGNYEKRRENYILIYFDFDINKVVYREINALLYFLLKEVNSRSLKDVLKEVCKHNKLDFKEAKSILISPLKELFSKKIFS